jgi:hypothetical protein
VYIVKLIKKLLTPQELYPKEVVYKIRFVLIEEGIGKLLWGRLY